MPSVTRGACKPPQSSLIQPLVIRQRPSHRGQQHCHCPAPAASLTKSCLQLPAPIPRGLATTPRAQHPPQCLLLHKTPPKPLPRRSQTWSRPQAAHNHVSHPSQLGGLGGSRAGAGMPPGLLQKVFSTVLVPMQVSMSQASTVSPVTLRSQALVAPPCTDSRRLPRGPTGRTEAAMLPGPGSPRPGGGFRPGSDGS